MFEFEMRVTVTKQYKTLKEAKEEMTRLHSDENVLVYETITNTKTGKKHQYRWNTDNDEYEEDNNWVFRCD